MPLLALPALDIALLAILCALISFGSIILVKFLTTVLPSDLPIIGDRLVRAVENASAKAESAMKRAIYGQLHWMARLIRYPVASVKGHLNYLLLVSHSLYAMGHKIVTVTIPHAIGALSHRVDVLHARAMAFTRRESAVLFHRDDVLHLRAINFTRLQASVLRALVLSQIAGLVATTKAQVASLIHRIDSTRAEVLAIAHAADLAISNQVAQYYAAALHFTRSAVADLSQHLDQLYQQSIAHADATAAAAASSAVGALEHQTALALSAAWPGLLDDIEGLEAALGTDLAQIGVAVRQIDLTKTRSIAEGLAVSTAVGVVALRYMRDCGVPNCKNLGPLGHVLHDLGLLIGGDSLFEFIQEFAHDPNGAAHTVIDETGNVIQDLTGNFLHLIGL